MGGIIVVADTHFGIKKGSISMPGYFADFLRWIKELEKENEQKVKILDRGTIKDKTLIKPKEIIFLGDILELWDSEDEAVNTCVSTLMPTLAEIGAEKIYVLGNHDNILDKALLSQEKEYYPLGNSNLKIVEEYPSEGFLKKGDQNYLFVHGHQFSPGFLFQFASAIDKAIYTASFHKLEIRTYDIIPSLKKIRNTMGTISWIFILLFLLSLLPYILNWIASQFGISNSVISWMYGHRINNHFVFMLGFISLPKILIDWARPIHNYFSGKLKYKKRETIENFTKWWKRVSEGTNVSENINVVYGHTHFLNYINLQEEEREKKFKKRPELYDFYQTKLRKRGIKERQPTLVNISAWMKDIKNKEKDEKYKNVMVASFLYIDDKGCEFFGWDWYEKRIFHIPKEVIIIRRETKKGAISDDMAKRLAKIGWPKKLIDKWQKPIKF